MPLRHPFTMNHELESVGVEPRCGSTRLLLYVDSHLEPCDVNVPVSLYTTYNGTSYTSYTVKIMLPGQYPQRALP